MKIHLVRVRLTITETWTIGAPEQAADDRGVPCATNPFGDLVVPSSSVAGSLRAHLAELGLPVEQIMGSETDGDISPSAVRVLGTSLTAPRRALERTRAAIDPTRGAAAAGMLATTEEGPAGTKVTIDLRIDGDPEWLDTFLDATTTWAPFIGRSRTSGKGSARVDSVADGTLDLQHSADLARWLASGGPTLVEEVATSARASAQPAEPDLLTGGPIEFRPTDGIFVLGPSNGGSTRVPYKRDDAYVVEGSSWKGILRSRAGFIARTLSASACIDPQGCSQADCVVCHLFGSGGRRGLVRVEASSLDPRRIAATRNHVSIDRFTGGARDKQLFSDTDVPIGGSMSLRVSALRPLPEWADLLLEAIALDIHDGYVGIGSSTTRGLGTARLDEAVAARFRSDLSRRSLATELTEWCTTQRSN